MSKWPMRGHFRYLRFKTFPMTPRTPQCKVFWPFYRTLNIRESRRTPNPQLWECWASPPHLAKVGLRQNGYLSRDSQGGVPKLSRFELPRFCEFITLCSYLRLGWGLKQTCSPYWELSNNVLHSICTHRCQFDSQLLVVRSQIVNLTSDLSFCHNLCCRCPNGSCKAIFDIYTSIAFLWHEERFKARCFDPCNRTVKFWES